MKRNDVLAIGAALAFAAGLLQLLTERLRSVYLRHAGEFCLPSRYLASGVAMSRRPPPRAGGGRVTATNAELIG